MVNDTILVNGKPLEDWLEYSKPVRPAEPELSLYACCMECEHPEYFESEEWVTYIQAMGEYQGEFTRDEKLFG